MKWKLDVGRGLARSPRNVLLCCYCCCCYIMFFFLYFITIGLPLNYIFDQIGVYIQRPFFIDGWFFFWSFLRNAMRWMKFRRLFFRRYHHKYWNMTKTSIATFPNRGLSRLDTECLRWDLRLMYASAFAVGTLLFVFFFIIRMIRFEFWIIIWFDCFAIWYKFEL